MKKFISILILLFSTTTVLLAQDPIVTGLPNGTVTLSSNSTITTCEGTYWDAGQSSNYSSSANSRTTTFCPQGTGNVMILNFTEFGICGNDRMEIYAGTGANASYLIGTYTGYTSPGTVSNVGCLTIRFTRSSSNSCSIGSRQGWRASINCMPVEYYGNAGNPGVSDGGTCFKANPFCSGQVYNFTNLTRTSAPSGPNYGCLYTQPNPVWYFMSISEAGSMQLSVSQSTSSNQSSSANLDIDFAMWGPFNSVAEGCTRILSGTMPPIQCSYDPHHTETVGLGYQGGTNYQSAQSNTSLLPGQTTPPATNQGEIYVLLLTNYSNRSGYIRFRKTAGNAESDCSIVLLPLGLEMATFQGEHKNGINYLQWVTQDERLMNTYKLQRSTDGFVWETIKSVNPKESEEESNHYTFEDTSFDNVENYYRLESENIDGLKNYSDIVSLDNRRVVKSVIAAYNELGQQVDANHKGFKVLVFSDGTTAKQFD